MRGFLVVALAVMFAMLSHQAGYAEGVAVKSRECKVDSELVARYREFITAPMCFDGCRFVVDDVYSSHEYWDCVDRAVASNN